jgi:hypothetical protein
VAARTAPRKYGYCCIWMMAVSGRCSVSETLRVAPVLFSQTFPNWGASQRWAQFP